MSFLNDWKYFWSPNDMQLCDRYNDGYRQALADINKGIIPELEYKIEERVKECVIEISGYCPPIRAQIIKDDTIESAQLFSTPQRIKPIGFKVILT